MKKSFIIKYLTTILCLLLMLALPFSAFAAMEGAADSYSLTVQFSHENIPVSDAPFSVYRIGQRIDIGGFALDEAFSDYSVTIEELDSEGLSNLAATLSAYIARDSVAADAKGTTDSEGSLVFEGMSKGLYLVVGDTVTTDSAVYTPQPFIIDLPNITEGEVLFNPTAEVKYDYTEIIEDTVERKVIKVWNDANNADRPDDVVVQLLRNGSIYDEVTLDANNNWRYTWSDLNADDTWSVVEKTVPDDYVVSVDREGSIFIITNTLNKKPEETTTPTTTTTIVNPTDSTAPTSPTTPMSPTTTSPTTTTKPQEKPSQILPNTGQLWWPVPVLVLAGFMLFAIGFAMRKRGNDENA